MPPIEDNSAIDPTSIFGAANAAARARELSGHVLWIDATANLGTLSTAAGVDAAVRRARDAHVNTLVVDVKPISGQTLYPSAIAPRLTEWKGRTCAPAFDPLAAIVEAAGRYGLSVAASVNVFSEGHRHFGVGPAYANPQWQCVGYGIDPATGRPALRRSDSAPWEAVSVWVSPHRADAREYELSLIDEIVRNYPIDGIVFDRMRYAGIADDFSDAAWAAFEAFIGRTVDRWPDDVTTPAAARVKGPLFDRWQAFRARTIRDFLDEAAAVARAARPGIRVGAYVGSWYGSYADVGVNWASPDYRAPGMDDGYRSAGYADLLDWLMTGCYYPVATRAEAALAGMPVGATVESAAALSNRVVADAALVYGGLYLLNYAGDADAFVRAARVCRAVTQGVMIFDMVYLDEWGWWDALRRALEAPAGAPHLDPDLPAHIRAACGGDAPEEIGDVPVSETP